MAHTSPPDSAANDTPSLASQPSPGTMLPSAQTGQQHPIGLYLKIWGLLFVLSTFSYLVDYANLHGLLRWGLIVLLMIMKAGLIVAVFMHMAWERLALVYAILIPPLCLSVLMLTMAAEADYTFLTRLMFFH